MKPAVISLLAFTLVFSLLAHARGQEDSCSVSTMSESSAPRYEQVARKAHVQGQVALLVQFAPNGKTTHVEVSSGHDLLWKSAIGFVRGWQTNRASGQRTCEVVLTFHLRQPNENKVPLFVRTSLRTGTVTVDALPPETQY